MIENSKSRLGRRVAALGRWAAAGLVFLGLPSFGRAAPDDEPSGVTARIDRLRARLAEAAAAEDGAAPSSPDEKHAGLWTDWNDWSDWNDWNNWGNFS